jgi:hypothetical protein
MLSIVVTTMNHSSASEWVFPYLTGPIESVPASLVILAAMASFICSFSVTGLCMGQGSGSQPLVQQSPAEISSLGLSLEKSSLR